MECSILIPKNFIFKLKVTFYRTGDTYKFVEKGKASANSKLNKKYYIKNFESNGEI